MNQPPMTEQEIRAAARRDVPPAVPEPELASLIAQLVSERTRLGWDRDELCRQAHLGRELVDNLEEGRIAGPSTTTLRAYARAVGKRVTYRLEGPEPQVRT